MWTRAVWRGAIFAITIAVSSPAALSAATAAAEQPKRPEKACAPGRGARADARGEWPSLNLDLANSRHQRETSLGVEDAGKLEPAWVFAAADAGLTGMLLSTPVAAGGCVFLALNDTADRFSVPPTEAGSGRVVALDATDGSVVWVREVNGNPTGLAVANGKVYVLPQKATAAAGGPDKVGPAGPHAIALDQSTGDVVWVSRPLGIPSYDEATGSSTGHTINASPVVFDGMLFVPLSGAAGDGKRVPLYLLDAETGEVVKEIHAISEAEATEGYSGAGIWSTAAVDRRTGHLYAGTADSEGHRKQHPYNNAILKIDVRRDRHTFGTVVGHYKGTPEQYVTALDADENPACGLILDTAWKVRRFDRSADPACAELDLDFGASPGLIPGRARGEDPIVAELQKSGVLHGVNAGDMSGRWTHTISHPTYAGNSSTGAFDDERYYVSAGPNVLAAVDPWTGEVLWRSTTVDAVRYHPLTVANGVLYTTSNFSTFQMFDARTGAVLATRILDVDTGKAECREIAGGVSIAYDTVFVPCDWHGAVVAYRPASATSVAP